MEQEPTTREPLNAIHQINARVDGLVDVIHTFASSVDERFNKVDGCLDKIDERLDK